MSEASNQIRGPHQGPHQGQPVLTAGEPLDKAKAAMIMVHGRGASAEDILSLTPELNQPGFAYTRRGRHSTRAHYPPGFFAGSMSITRICGSQRSPLWWTRRLERRPYRSRWNATRLSRISRWHPRLSRLQRRRSPCSQKTRRDLRRSAAKIRGKCHHSPVSSHGSYDQSR